MWTEIAVLPVDPQTCRIYAEGWQSWSPSRIHSLGAKLPYPTDANVIALGYRAGSPPGPDPQGEGLLAVDDGSATHVFSGPDLPSLRAVADGAAVRVEATGDATHEVVAAPLRQGVQRWGDAFAGAPNLRPAPTVWCSWYEYFIEVTEADVLENLEAMDALDIPIDVVQLDDGYEREIGDWLTLSGRFESLPAMVERIRGHGRRAGIWVAPFLVGQRSQVAREHPDWVAPGLWAGRNWGQDLYVLDLGAPGAAAWLAEVFGRLHDIGFDYFKIDFVYAGALPGLDHYREGLRIIGEAIGDSYLVGCGAPVLPSVGLVDAMRISSDTAPHYETTEGDPSQPGQCGALANGVARAWQHGRFWVNDADCLLARPGVQRREEWADHVTRYGGLRASSDRLRSLDDWGLRTTRALLSSVPPPQPWELD